MIEIVTRDGGWRVLTLRPLPNLLYTQVRMYGEDGLAVKFYLDIYTGDGATEAVVLQEGCKGRLIANKGARKPKHEGSPKLLKVMQTPPTCD